MMHPKYDAKFYTEREDSLRSARVMVPFILEYVHANSILDVGCGTGALLSTFKANGASSIFGIDGPWVPAHKRLISNDCFQPRNLEETFALGKTFDLVTSLEVAEHLPASMAERFVADLTRHGDVILFSAAIPGQGGVNHVNEQWPGYWVQLFAARGYVAVDCLRTRLWNNSAVCFWYAQNIMFFVRDRALDSHEHLRKEFECTGGSVQPLVHPTLFEAVARKANRPTRLGAARSLVRALIQELRPAAR